MTLTTTTKEEVTFNNNNNKRKEVKRSAQWTTYIEAYLMLVCLVPSPRSARESEAAEDGRGWHKLNSETVINISSARGNKRHRCSASTTFKRAFLLFDLLVEALSGC